MTHLEEYQASITGLRRRIRELKIACAAQSGIGAIIHGVFDPTVERKQTQDHDALLRKAK